MQAFKVAVNSGRYLSQDARTEKPFEHIQKKVQALPAHQKFKADPDSPDDVFHFHRSIKTLNAALPKQQNVPPAEVFKDRLATICFDTNTFIVKPEDAGDICHIWGEPEHVSRAKEALHAFEMNLVDPSRGQRATPSWAKQLAFDGREENRLMRENWMSRQRQFFQQETDDSTMPYQAHLYWPDGYDLDKFIEDYKDNVLPELMDKFDCIIRQQPVERVTKVACDTQQVLFQVYNRLMGLTREMVAKKQAGLYATHCEVPGLRAYRDRVKLVRAVTGNERINIPTLTGKSLPPSEQENWAQLSSDINKRYRIATKNALRSCISALHVSQKHLKLRVIFGEIGLTQVMKAEDGQDTYRIDDFLTKVQKSGTKVLQCPLKEGKSFQFIDNIESHEAFSPLDISWEVVFNFSGAHNSTLRLVKEYIPNIVDLNEPSVAATRWLTYSDSSLDDKFDFLNVNHIDMERTGYQLRLGGGTIFQNQKTLQSLQSFENNITFRPSWNGLRYDPNKHVTHPYGNQELNSICEVTIARYRFKQTRGTFEIRRTDHFNARPGESSPVAHRTEWSAQYYYAGWDNLLSDFANIDPGQDIEWKRDLKTFFPKVEDIDNPQVLPRGFKHFMKEVDEIQNLITKAVGHGNQTNTN